ncbi:SRPBCC family protein [Paenibacillus piri]|uniref:SRPBCC domain-containing protein n=1 Tax=Paenibacillus piri TaxID=2547395 RepID=A0A4R5KE31_9BACL|nr:SRPBCC domain-containing protein [Paenibacillus piri]TDF92808.1 SRPBCC domain-containing protein [Paenibacillus piri]
MAANKSVEQELLITRVFDAPRESVFEAWTEAERLSQWWGPQGYELEVKKLELYPGGLFLGSQRSPEGHVMWGKFVYKEIVAPEKLVFVQSFSDEDGNTIRAPFSGTWPLEVINYLILTENGGKTTLTLRGGPYQASEEELATYESMRPHIQQGLVGTFDQLDAYLART